MTSVPGGTLTGAPSIVSLIMPSAICRLPSADHYRLALACEIGFEFAPKLLDPTYDRSRDGVGEHADRLARLVLGEIEEQVEVFGLALPRQDPLHDLGRPGSAFAALRALRARLVCVEACQAHDLVDHIRRVVEYDHTARAEHGPRGDDALVVEEAGFGLLARQDRHRRAAGDARLEGTPRGGPAAHVVQQILE